MNLTRIIFDMTQDTNQKGWSDIHIQEGERLAYRNKNGSIINLNDEIVTKQDIEEMVMSKFESDGFKSLKELMDSREGDVDFAMSISLDDISSCPRFRCNLHYFNGKKVGLIMRKINEDAVDINELGLPKLARTFNKKSAGLILVTGPTGSGKSTTLAAMIDEINKTEEEHIVTVEDPIEYVFKPEKCRITQREIGNGKDSISFNKALRAALRQDPDVVLVGEIRDAETANMCLEASQTGHLVLGTLHTKDSVGTINRFVQMFPSDERGRVRDVLADSLIGVISQILVPKIGGGKVMACEVMAVNQPIRTTIRDEDKQKQMKNMMNIGKKESGMQALNDNLIKLVEDEVITPENAMLYCVDADDMQGKLENKGYKVDSELEDKDNKSSYSNSLSKTESQPSKEPIGSRSNGRLSVFGSKPKTK